MSTNYEFVEHIFIQLASNLLDRRIEIIRVMSEETTTIVPVNGAGGHNIYPPLHVLFYEESQFIHGHFQSIRPNSVSVRRPQLPSVPDSIGQPEFQSTNVSENCDTATCNQNSTVFSESVQK